MTAKQLILFDLDGTLIDSAGDLHDAVNRMLAALDRAPLTLTQVIGMIGNGVPTLVKRALAASPGAPVEHETAMIHFNRAYDAEPTRLTTVFPGVATTLELLAATGRQLAVCTNKHESSARHILGKLGLAQYFRHLIAGDSLPFRKPDPRVITETLSRLKLTTGDAVMVGDSEVDAATAAAAGVDFILMTYGYHHGPVEAIAADHRLDRFADLAPLFV
ncbi:phosphoglycolate phosphatase [Aliidongia dinghuensis]|uniref:Phosphoglycolate phosphatase n=1 Tax=Aliidongia dinghuensis TaxID=1867774 RepID=A0A8J2YY59_9PROT|nr:phosphoglycolate phosphatase [Aliidongia dinghuensis]GGF35190.1 phosphoglycolate phosphatase [Aliidongia dinghuensis]